jgi:hypothetical protein
MTDRAAGWSPDRHDVTMPQRWSVDRWMLTVGALRPSSRASSVVDPGSSTELRMAPWLRPSSAPSAPVMAGRLQAGKSNGEIDWFNGLNDISQEPCLPGCGPAWSPRPARPNSPECLAAPRPKITALAARAGREREMPW